MKSLRKVPPVNYLGSSSAGSLRGAVREKSGNCIHGSTWGANLLVSPLLGSIYIFLFLDPSLRLVAKQLKSQPAAGIDNSEMQEGSLPVHKLGSHSSSPSIRAQCEKEKAGASCSH